MYRYVKRVPLDTGHKYGDILKRGDLKPESIEALLKKGVLVKVSSPPLTEVPGFTRRADILGEAGIETIENLAEGDANEIANRTGKAVTTIRRWQSEAMQWLAPPEPKKDKP